MGVINWETLQIWCNVEEKGFELKKNNYRSRHVIATREKRVMGYSMFTHRIS